MSELIEAVRAPERETAADPLPAPAAVRPALAAVLLGPAMVAALAYVDPGNFATCFLAGAQDGYRLLWAVSAASLAAAFVQYLSARLGAVTGRGLAELCRLRYSRPIVLLLWGQAEIVCMATDVAEIVGAALALNLLFGLPLQAGALLAGALSFVLLALTPRGQAGMERVMAGALAAVFLLLLVLVGFAHPSFRQAAVGLVPGLPGGDAVALVAGIVGATVMPHVIYLHSALTADGRPPASGRRVAAVMRVQRSNTAIAMTVASIANVALVIIAAALLGGRPGVSLADAFPLFGRTSATAALAFGCALLVAGLASATVGIYAGQEVMRGFLRKSPPLAVRRLATLLPSVAVLSAGVPPATALLVSQVVLSFGIPFALVALLLQTRREARATPVGGVVLGAAWAVTALIVLLNGATIAALF
jgi:manganese transport protein